MYELASTVITLGGIAAAICTLGHICETTSRKIQENTK